MGNFETAVRYFKEGKFDDALAEVNQCLSHSDDDLSLYFFRARVNSRIGKLEASLSDFDHLLRREPYNPTYISDRAVVLHLLNRNEEARDAFDQALNLEPQNPYRYSSRAYFRDRIGDIQGAIEDYEQAIILDPEDAVAYNNKGLAEEKLGYTEKSRKSFKKADELVGYQPENLDDNTIKKESPYQDNIRSGKPSPPTRSLSLPDYLQVLKDVFTDSSTAKEFWTFLTKGFRK